jgi:cysteine desulfurase family protein
MIYMDNGATSCPKPREVIDAVKEAMEKCCANPGRSGHDMAAHAAREIFRTRQTAAKLFNIDDPGRIVFTKNCTEALNIALKGVLHEGDHVITTSMEHNSVIRPLYQLQQRRIYTTIVPCDKAGRLDPAEIRKAIRPETKMIVMTAASNVTGTRMPLEEAGRIALRRGILFMVDGAQGAGHMEIDAKRHHIDILAVPGHKGLMGPQGTGFLYVKEGIKVDPLMEGGTGSRSKDMEQPDDFPEGFEAGTVNVPGIIGLGAALKFIDRIGVNVIEEYERKLTEQLQQGLGSIKGVTLYGPENAREKTAVAAVNIGNMDCEEAAAVLNDRYGIAVRAGFHCSGLAHRTIGTERTGCIRFSPGFYTSEEEIQKTIEAVKEIAADRC